LLSEIKQNPEAFFIAEITIELAVLYWLFEKLKTSKDGNRERPFNLKFKKLKKADAETEAIENHAHTPVVSPSLSSCRPKTS
jgi:hypothetical protein